MKQFLLMLAPLLLLCGQAQAADGFENVRCDGDIVKAMRGAHTSEEPVVKIEARHTALALKDLGGDIISDHLSSVSWSICGREFITLEDDHDVVRDVLEFPHHDKATPEFTAMCTRNGRELPDTFVGVMDNRAGGTPPDLAVLTAWRIDEAHGKFVPTDVAGLRCPRDGIFSVDGGQ